MGEQQPKNPRYYIVTGKNIAEVKEKIKRLRKRIPEHPQFSEMSRILTSPQGFAEMRISGEVETISTKEVIDHGYFAKYENIPVYVNNAIKTDMVAAEKFES